MIRVGMIGTSKWAGSMYLSALQDCPHGQIQAVCARDPEKTQSFAQEWAVDRVFTNWEDLLDSGEIDAVIIAVPNHLHHRIAMHALNNNIHVLCEKPLALSFAEADEIATTAEQRQLIGMTAFTYWYFPHYQYMAHLVRTGYVGQPYHLNFRYYSDYFTNPEPLWRFDVDNAGPGVLADLGSHAFAIARLLLGDVVAVAANLETRIHRRDIPVDQHAVDQAMVMLRFASGANAVLHISGVAPQPRYGGAKQGLELSGSEGTLYYANDFRTSFALEGGKPGDEVPMRLDVPDSYWPPQVSRKDPRSMFTDLFQKTDVMARGWLRAIATGEPMYGTSLREGAHVQKIQDTAVRSAAEGSRWLRLD